MTRQHITIVRRTADHGETVCFSVRANGNRAAYFTADADDLARIQIAAMRAKAHAEGMIHAFQLAGVKVNSHPDMIDTDQVAA